MLEYTQIFPYRMDMMSIEHPDVQTTLEMILGVVTLAT